MLGFCSTSCSISFIASRSKPACIGRSEEGGLSLSGVDGLDKVEASSGASPPKLVIVFDCEFGAGEDILGGRSSLTSSSPALLGELLISFFRLAEVTAEGGRTTCFCGVVLVFFRENHPDFFLLSSSRTTIRSSVNSGSYIRWIKHAESITKNRMRTNLWLVKVIRKHRKAKLIKNQRHESPITHMT